MAPLAAQKPLRVRYGHGAGPRTHVAQADFGHMHAYIHTYIHTFIHSYIHACTHTYIHTYIHTCSGFRVVRVRRRGSKAVPPAPMKDDLDSGTHTSEANPCESELHPVNLNFEQELLGRITLTARKTRMMRRGLKAGTSSST